MNRKAFPFLLAIFAVVLLTSCKREDEDAPIVQTAHEFEALMDTINLQAPVDYSISIFFQDGGDGVDQYRMAFQNDSVASGDINRIEVSNPENSISSIILNDTLSFDDECMGRWTLEVSASDESGNLTSDGPYLFVITNPFIPVVQATDWSCSVTSDQLSLNDADTLQVNFNASDADGLYVMSLRLLEAGVETLNETLNISGGVVSDSLKIDIPESLTDDAILELIVSDIQGFTSRQRYQLSP